MLPQKKIMKIKTIICAALTAGLLATPAFAKDKLEAKARITKAEAMKTALAKVPGGKVKEGELEEENGKLIWSFDIATKGSKDITEVAVDAITGEIVAVATETPADQAKEKQADKLEAKAKVAKADAQKTALGKVPGGKVIEGGLEEEKGKLIWSFDISTEGTKDITEVVVDASTGEIVSVDIETPADQAKEKAEDAAKEKGEKDDDDNKTEKK